MGYIESITFFSAFGLYLVLSLMLVLRAATPPVYRLIGITILALLGSSIAFRWADTSHPPILGTFEEALAASWMLMLFSVILDPMARFAFITVPMAFLTLLYGLGYDLSGRPLVISEQSLWVYFHVLFAWVAYGFYTLSFGASVCVLLGKRSKYFESVDKIKKSIYNWLLYGLTAQTVMFVIGSYYSSLLHGSWWIWDPVEYLFIVSWFLFSVAIHGRLFFGWNMEKVSAWTVAAFFATMVLYWGLTLFPWATYHIFDPEIKTHFFY